VAERYAQAACETRFHFLTMLLCAAFVGSSLAQEKKLTSANAKPAFDRADKTLNAAWKESMKTLPESEFNKLKEDQRAWVAHRDYLARSPMFTGAEGLDDLALDSPGCLVTAARLAEERSRCPCLFRWRVR
jgi:hypothetical protein